MGGRGFLKSPKELFFSVVVVVVWVGTCLFAGDKHAAKRRRSLAGERRGSRRHGAALGREDALDISLGHGRDAQEGHGHLQIHR